MVDSVYLDAARLGLMSPSAQRVNAEFARLAGDSQSLLYFGEFFTRGWDAWPLSMRRRYPDLEIWRGTLGLATAVRRFAAASRDTDVLFASRSASLMRLAAWQLAIRCERVVTVDLLWPPYRKILADVCRQAGASLSIVRLRDATSAHRASPPWISELIRDEFVRFGAQGLMLPLLTHRGIRLPLESMVSRLRHEVPSTFVAVDGAQAFGHLPLRVSPDWCDLLIGGSHKWLGGYHPLGIAIATDLTIASELPSLLSARRVDDPLLRLCSEFTGKVRLRHGETASVAPLLSAQGAITDALRGGQRSQLAARLRNRRHVSRILRRSGWRTLQASENAGHGIIHAKPPLSARQLNPESMRHLFRRHHIAVTVYADSTVRMSLPSVPLSEMQRRQLRTALDTVAA